MTGFYQFAAKAGFSRAAVYRLRNGQTLRGLKQLSKDQFRTGQKYAKKVGSAASKFVPDIGDGLLRAGVRGGFRLVPFLGSGYSLMCAYRAFKDGDLLGGVLNSPNWYRREERPRCRPIRSDLLPHRRPCRRSSRPCRVRCSEAS